MRSGPLFPMSPVLLAFLSWALAAPIRPGQELSRFGREGIGPSQMSRVNLVAVDAQGFIYAADDELARVQRFDPTGKLLSLFYFNHEVEALALDRGGSLYVVVLRRLFRYDPATWTLQDEIRRLGSYEFLAVAPRREGGIIALVQAGKNEILFIEDGKVVRSFEMPVPRYVSSINGPALA